MTTLTRAKRLTNKASYTSAIRCQWHLMLQIPRRLPADRHAGSLRARQADRHGELAEMNLQGFLRSAAMDACVFLCLAKRLAKRSNLDEKIKTRTEFTGSSEAFVKLKGST